MIEPQLMMMILRLQRQLMQAGKVMEAFEDILKGHDQAIANLQLVVLELIQKAEGKQQSDIVRH